MSKVKSLKKALAKVTKSVEKANKSSKGKESKLEEAVKQIEDMSKKPAFVRLRQMANKNRKRKGLPLKPELSDIPEARQNMMTPAQKRRARKTQKDLGPSARRDMKEAQRARKARRAKIGKGLSKSDKDALTALAITAPVGIAGAAVAGKELADRSRLNREARRRAFDNARKKAKRENNPTFTVSGKTYNTETGRKVEKKANGGMASAAKTIANGTTRSRNKAKPRGVGAAMRGYGKALKK